MGVFDKDSGLRTVDTIVDEKAGKDVELLTALDDAAKEVPEEEPVADAVTDDGVEPSEPKTAGDDGSEEPSDKPGDQEKAVGDDTEEPVEETTETEEPDGAKVEVKTTKESYFFFYPDVSRSMAQEGAVDKSLELLSKGAGIAAPLVASGVKRGLRITIKLLLSLGRNMLSLASNLKKAHEARLSKYKKLEEQLVVIRDKLKLIEQPMEPEKGASFINKKAYLLTVAGNSDVANAVSSASKALATINGTIIKQAEQRRDVVKKLLDMGIGDKIKDPEGLMRTQMDITGFKKGVPSGYQKQSSLIVGYQYGEPLPGGYVVVMYTPSTGITELTDIRKAYAEAEMLVGVTESDHAKAVPYLNKEGVIALLDNLIASCQLAIKSQMEFQVRIFDPAYMRLKVSTVISGLISSKAESEALNKLAEYAILQNRFIDTLLHTGIRDVHRLNHRVLEMAETFVNENIKALTKGSAKA